MANQFVPNPIFNPGAPISAGNPTVVSNSPSQAAVDSLFPPGTGRLSEFPNPAVTDAANRCRVPSDLAAGGRFRLNRDGTVFTGLADAASLVARRVPVQRPGLQPSDEPAKRRPRRRFPGLPVFVMQPDGRIKENILYHWASSPLERLSGFANGHFDVSDNVRVTGQAMVTRTKTESSLGLSSANINQWGAGVPFGGPGTLYRGNTNPYFDIPDSLIDNNGNGIADAGDATHPDYTPTGRLRRELRCGRHGALPWV